MTTTERRPSSRGSFAGTSAAAMLRGALPPTVVVGAVVVVASALLAGSSGLWGGLFGAGLVVVSFSLSLVVLGSTRGIDPALVLLVAMALYFAKVVALGVVLFVATQAGWIGDPLHRTALGAGVIACTLTWTVFEIVAAVKHREPLYDLGEEGP